MLLSDSFAARVPDETWILPIRHPDAQLEFERKAGSGVQVMAGHSRISVVLQSPILSLLTAASGSSGGIGPILLKTSYDGSVVGK